MQAHGDAMAMCRSDNGPRTVKERERPLSEQVDVAALGCGFQRTGLYQTLVSVSRVSAVFFGKVQRFVCAFDNGLREFVAICFSEPYRQGDITYQRKVCDADFLTKGLQLGESCISRYGLKDNQKLFSAVAEQ